MCALTVCAATCPWHWDSGTGVSKKLDLSSDKLCVTLGNCVIQLMKHVMGQDLFFVLNIQDYEKL